MKATRVWRGAESQIICVVTSQVTQFVENCRDCTRVVHPRREPLLYTPLPDYPWQVVASDLFKLKGEHYLLVVDYFSHYPEVIK